MIAAALALLLLPSGAAARAGDVYMTDVQLPGIYRIGPGGGNGQVVAQGPPLVSPQGMSFLPNGQILVADFNVPGVFRVDPRTGQIFPFASGPFAKPQDAELGPDGHVYVSDGINDAVYRLNRRTGAISPLASGPPLDGPRGVEFDRAGNAYVAGDGLVKVTRSGAATVLFQDPAFDHGAGIALSPDERIAYVVDFEGTPNGVWRINLRTGAGRRIAVFPDAYFIDRLASGRFLVTDDSARKIYLMGPDGTKRGVFSQNPAFQEPNDVLVEPRRCRARIPTLVGTRTRNLLRGGPFRDVIAALGGHDRVAGGRGRDVVCAGPGRDRVFGGAARDVLLGQQGADRLFGGAAGDLLLGHRGRDRLYGGRGRDRLFGGPAFDLLRGGPGRDVERQ